MKFLEPTKGVGMRKLFSRAGYEVVLVDEFRTSCTCFGCEGGACKKFRWNPRPWKREERPMVLRNGLLSCMRLWNRDHNGSLNIMRCAQAARRGEQRPSYTIRNFSGAKSAATTQGAGLPTMMMSVFQEIFGIFILKLNIKRSGIHTNMDWTTKDLLVGVQLLEGKKIFFRVAMNDAVTVRVWFISVNTPQGFKYQVPEFLSAWTLGREILMEQRSFYLRGTHGVLNICYDDYIILSIPHAQQLMTWNGENLSPSNAFVVAKLQ